ncbi:YitT family protein [Fundicoccus culcitae]|uniref:YitT family protein n=1 Tax=Fundicoccus culcitae TaxID=2969821 RepID=A0ABY5P6T9_9LACT|nr:YitT family protein [Fundicoccus culcitae]UUX34123.1 YitT family protein [Fundicoccus culcitae]
MLSKLLSKLSLSKKEVLLIALGCLIMAFGIVNVHGPSKITEGGVIGLVLFSDKVLGLDPSLMSIILDLVCYILGFSMLGWTFLRKALVASGFFAIFYKFFLWTGPVMMSLYDYPIIAAVVGGIFIGVGCGLVVTQGGAAGGDDALAMVISNRFNISLSRAYLVTDGVVLLLSLTYIAPTRLIYSLLTTLVSSFLIGQIEVRITKPTKAMETVKTLKPVNPVEHPLSKI